MMVFSKRRAVGLVCTTGTLLGALIILHQIAKDDSFVGLEKLLDPQLLSLLFILYACHFLAEPLRWLAYSYCERDVQQGWNGRHFVQIFACFNTTALLSYSLPFKLGLPLRLYLLSHYLALENMRVVKLMALDGILNLFCWALFAVSLVLLAPAVAGPFTQYLDTPAFYLAATLMMVAACWLALKRRQQLLALMSTVAPRVIVLVVVTLIVDVMFYGIRHMVLADALAFGVEAEIVFVIGILATFAGIISTLPMGLGAYDATLVALLAMHGVEVELGVMLAVSNRLGMIGTSIILGVPSAVMLAKVDRKVAEA